MPFWRLPRLPRSRIAGASSAEAFRGLLMGTSVLAMLTHGCFSVLFWLSGVPLLAWVNVASMLLYGLCFRLMGRKHMLTGLLLMGGEVMGHAVLAVILVGWDSGFHYYVMLVVPVALVSTQTPEWIKWIFALGTVTGYVVLDVLWRQAVPPYALSPAVLNGLHYFNIVSALVILAFLTATYFRLVARAEGRLRELATTDPLTRLLNRRALRERIALEERRQQREAHKPLSFVLADVDHFKAINDQHGHEVGDQVLVQVAAALGEGVREVDHLARWGGEEFLIVLPDTDELVAGQVAERLRQAVAGLQLPGGSRGITATLGVAERAEGESPDQAISRADEALYAGKRSGRDRVVCASKLPSAGAAPSNPQ
ncbi:MAG TPA: GGDEF domain-containing protein [Candidatus Aquabacterium excrementipullorum]|nr:GGDEF domain-containing protein [Candidatus Aquabacterium excrementipullorum]